MNSPIKMPPLPTIDIGGKDVRQVWFRESEVLAYAEQAVREALAEAAAKLEVLAQETFEWPGVAGAVVHMAYHQAISTVLAIIPENNHE